MWEYVYKRLKIDYYTLIPLVSKLPKLLLPKTDAFIHIWHKFVPAWPEFVFSTIGIELLLISIHFMKVGVIL